MEDDRNPMRAAGPSSMSWASWINAILGVWLIISPWVLGFAMVQPAVWSCVVLGVIVALASIWGLWTVHHPAAIA